MQDTQTIPSATTSHDVGTIEMFFDEPGLQRILVYFSQQQQLGVDDALSNIILTVMSSIPQLKMNKNGVFLFNNAMFIYPFSEMTTGQVACLESLLLRTEQSLSNMPPCLYDDLANLYGFSISEHMGGSHTINFSVPPNFTISTESILKAVARATFSTGNSAYSTTLRRHCFSVIIQRIMSMSAINREIIVHVNEYVEQLVAMLDTSDTTPRETPPICQTQPAALTLECSTQSV
jgi:hypothetical protein